MNPILVLLIVFVVTLILGVPFAWSLLLASAASICLMDGLPLMTIASKMYNGGSKYTLLAIFFFMLVLFLSITILPFSQRPPGPSISWYLPVLPLSSDVLMPWLSVPI